MVFKVKQRAKSDYYDHVPDQANVAPSERRDIGAPSLGSGPFKPQLREYPIQYNWPYDYVSLVEMARLDVEVLFRPGTQANRENDRKIENKTTERAALDKKRTRKMSSRIGARKKEDRLEALLCPIVNRRKMFVKKEHANLIDEMFEFPKGRNDDLLDGLWYAVTTAKPPKSSAIDANKLEDKISKIEESRAKRVINWVTGQKI